MSTDIAAHYRGSSDLAEKIRRSLAEAGKDLERITTRDLATVDEFHIRGRRATLELAERMALTPESRVLDVGSGLGGPARTLAETYSCEVVGMDLTPAFCETANRISEWLVQGFGDPLAIAESGTNILPRAAADEARDILWVIWMEYLGEDGKFMEGPSRLQMCGIGSG